MNESEFIGLPSPRKGSRSHSFRRSGVSMVRTLNLPFLAILLVIATVFGGGMHLVHGIQIQRNASTLLDRARRAEASQDLAKAEQSLSEYLNLRHDDGAVWKWYARVVDQQKADRRRLDRVFLVNEQALRYNPGDSNLERRCADLALEMERYIDAQRFLVDLDKQIPRDSHEQPAATDRAALAELEDLQGRCEFGQNQFDKAEQLFKKAIEHEPGRVSCYDRLARLRRSELRRSQAANGTINEMVAKNPKAGRSYLYRWRYTREFSPPPDPNDLQKALELAPDDPQVLLSAAVASEEKPDAAAARAYFKKGFKLDPKNSALALGLAHLEAGEQHVDRAEAVLRQAYEANPVLTLAFELADNLILQNKIEGKDQANDYIALLRNTGLGDAYVRFLDAEILFQQKEKDWAEVIPKIEKTRAVLRADPRLSARLNLMLAECYDRVGSAEQRLDALRQVADGDWGAGAARVAYAGELARSGKLDPALAILLPLAERQPKLNLEVVRLLIQRTLRQPSDRRDWREVEQRLLKAEKAFPNQVEVLTFLRVELLTAQNHHEDARSLLAAAQLKYPRNLPYRLALARLTQRQGNGPLARQILDQAEKDLGPGPDIQLARLESWGLQGGDEAKVAVAKLAGTRKQIPAAEQLAFLDQLAQTEVRLRELPLARQHWREMAVLQPRNLRVLLGLFNLALLEADHADALNLVGKIHKVEGQHGAFWRFAQAMLLFDQAPRDENKDRKMSRYDIDVIRALAAEIAEQRPDWWGGPLLRAKIAESEGRADEAVGAYVRAIDLGNSQPEIIRDVIGSLSDRRRFADIDRLVTSLRDRGIAAEDLAIATAFDAIRKKDYERGLALARQVIPAKSTRYGDHLLLGSILMSSRKVEEAGKEFRQAVELAPLVPETWRLWVEYLARTNQAQAAREAAAAADKALSALGSTLTLAQCHWSAGEASKAEALFGKAIKEQPHDGATLRLAANFFLEQNRVEQAAPLAAELLKPESNASQADVAWAKRTKMMLSFAEGIKPEQVEQALRLVEKDLKFDSNDFDSQRMRAVLLSMQFSHRKESIQALESIDRAQELTPRDRFLLVTLYSAEGNWPKCRTEMRKILEDSRRQPRQLAFYVDLMTRLGELDEAEKWLRILKPLVPRDQTGVALELEARLLNARKRDRELAVLIKDYVQLNPDQMRVGAVLFDRFGLLKEAEQTYRADVARNPNDTARALALVEFLARQNRPKEALDVCEPAVGTWRPEAVALASVAICKAKSVTEPQRRKLETWLRDLVRQKPDNVVLNTRLADLLTLRGNYTESEAIYRQSLGANRDNVEALNNLSWQLALRENKPEEALTLVDRALDIAGPNPTLLDTRAVILMELSLGDKAVEAILESVRLQPDKPVRYFHLARAYHMTHAPSEARKALERSRVLGLHEEIIDPLERETYRKLSRKIALR